MLCTYLYTYLQDNGFFMMFAWDVCAFLMHCDLWVLFPYKKISNASRLQVPDHFCRLSYKWLLWCCQVI